MTTIKLKARSDADGNIHLDVPVGAGDVECEVSVSVEVKTPGGWLPGFLDRFREGWMGEELVRGPQGEYAQREPLQ